MANNPAADIIDLRAIFRKLLARWWWFVITCGLAGAAGVAYLKVTPKSYLVQAKMLMGEGNKNGFGQKEDFLKGMSLVKGNSQLEDDIALMTSRSNMLRTLQRLDLGVSYYERKNFMTGERYDYPPFHVKIDSVAVVVTGIPIHVQVDRVAKTYRVTAEGKNLRLYNVQKQELVDDFVADYKIDQTVPIGQPFVGDHLSFKIDFPEDRVYETGSDYFFKINSLEAQFMNYSSRLSVEPPEDDGHIVKLSMTAHVPNKESAFINKLMETFIETALHKQQQKGIKTIDFIDDQIEDVADSLRIAESEMEGTRSSTSVLSSVASTSDALFQERSRLEDERSTIVRRRAYCASILEKIRSANDLRNVPAPSSSGVDDPVLNNLVIEITRLSADLAAQNIATGARSNPTVIAMERRIKNLTASLAQNAESLVEEASISLAEVNRRLSGIGYSLSQIPKGERELGMRQRKLDLSGGLYNYLMEKKAEAGIAIASDEVDKSIVDEARVEGGGAIGPDKKVVLGGALLVGLLVPVLIILVRDFFNDKISDLDELKRASKLPLLAMIPASKRKRVTPDEPKSMLAEAFRTVRINLQYLNANVPRQVLGFTSSSSGEGKTFCAVNLATVMALGGKRVLLVDADMRRPNVTKTLEMTDGPGLSSWLINEVSLNDIVRKTDIPGLDMIGAGPIPPNPSELSESPRLGELMAAMRERYDHIIVDASPIGLVSEFVVLMGHLDLSLYVVRERRTRRSALRLINELAQNGKVGRVDLLLNDVKSNETEGYGYYTK
ncbi:MAG: polysaccharide biosynthesis tyrosine autokinase [Flavobacteriales bacterium]|nr:polysaccharide biosynthesis tyrosine autokinase [Flavobacteriales bacterium]